MHCTLFATHYHELVDLAEEFDGVRNVNVAVKEWGDSIVFQHKIVPGGTDRSYGLHVARLAGVPGAVTERARQILGDLEQSAPDVVRRRLEVLLAPGRRGVQHPGVFRRGAVARAGVSASRRSAGSSRSLRVSTDSLIGTEIKLNCSFCSSCSTSESR